MKQFLNSLSNRNKFVSALRLRLSFLFVTAVLAVSAVVGLSGSTAGAWSSEDGAVAVWGGLTENDGNYAQFNNETGWESLAVDAAGSMYLTGRFQSSVDFNASPTGTTTMTAANNPGCNMQTFVMKLDLFAEPYWAGQFGNDVSNSSCYVFPRSIAVDGNGNVYTTGTFNYGSVDFDPGAGVTNLVNTYVQKQAAFVSKLNSSGELVWAYRIGSENVPGTLYDGGHLGEAKTYSVAADGAGNVYVLGTFWGSTSFQHGAGVTTLNSSRSEHSRPDTFILKLNSSGEQVWLRQIEAPTGNRVMTPLSVAVDGSGNVYSAGDVGGGSTIDFDPSEGVANLTVSTAGQTAGNDVWILKLDSAGNYVWAKASECNGSSDSYITAGNDRSLAVDGSGNVHLVGRFQQRHYNDSEDCDFDPGPGEAFAMVGQIQSDSGFVWKLDSAGNYQWVKAFLKAEGQGVNNRTSVHSVAVDGSGNVYSTGQFEGMVDFDPGEGTATMTGGQYSNRGSVFLSKLDSSGNYVWAKQFGTLTTKEDGRQVALDGSGNVHLSGYILTNAEVDYDPGNGVLNLTDKEMFLVKLDSSGNLAPGGFNAPTGNITVSPTSLTVAESGTTATFTVVLGAVPASDVVLSLTASDTGEATIDTSTLTFTGGNWATPQTVTVTGISDDAVDGDQNSTITISVVDASSPTAYQAVADSQISVVTTDTGSATPTLITGMTATQCGTGLEPTPDGNNCVPMEIPLLPPTAFSELEISLFASAAGSDGYVNWVPSTTNGLLEYVLAWFGPSGQPQTRTFDNTEIPEDVFYDLEDGIHSFEVLGSYANGDIAMSNRAYISVPIPPPPPTENPEPIEVEPFDCEAFPSLIQVMGTPGLGHTVKQLDVQTGAYSDIFSISFNRNPRYTHLNGIGINPVDGALYGLMRVKGFGYLVRFDMAGNVGFVARVPAHSNAGDVDGLGRFIWPSGKNFYAISGIADMDSFSDPGDAVDMSRISPVHIRSGSGGHGIADAAALKVDLGQGERYYAMGVHTSDRKLRIYSYDNPTGFWTIDLKINGSPAQLTNGGFGAAWSHEDKIYFSSNSGDGVYEILIPSVNLNVGTANIRRVANSQASAINDGTTCIGIDFIPPPPTTTTTPNPTEPDPTSNPFAPDPTEPDPAPDPTEPDPTEPVPAPDPTEPGPLPQPSEPDPAPEPFAPDPTEPDPAPDPTEPDPTESLEEDETPTSTMTTLNIEEEVTSQALSKVETEDNEGLDEQSTKEALGRTSDSGSSTWRIILIFFVGVGIFLIVAVLRRKRCLHCGRPLTLKDDILFDDDDNPECEENPEGKEHELRSDNRNEHENTAKSN